MHFNFNYLGMDDNNLFGNEEDERNDEQKGEQVRFQDIFNSIKNENRKPKSRDSEDEDREDTTPRETNRNERSSNADDKVKDQTGTFDFRKFDDRGDRNKPDRGDRKDEPRTDRREGRKDYDTDSRRDRPRRDDRGEKRWSERKDKPRDDRQSSSRRDSDDRDRRPFERDNRFGGGERKGPFGQRDRSPRRSRPEDSDRDDRGGSFRERRDDAPRSRDFDRKEDRGGNERSFDQRENLRSEDRIKARRIKSTRTEAFDKFASFYLGESNADYRSKIQEQDKETGLPSNKRTTRRDRPGQEERVEQDHDTTSTPKRERISKDTPAVPSVMRLNKYIAKSGLCSRRKAAELVKAGEVTVNGVVEIQPAYEVKDEDVIMHQGEVLEIQDKMVYLLLNKPKNFITTLDDEQDRRTVMELVEDKTDVRIYPVGRLDRNTTGLLLFTNDGDLAKQLSHPSYRVQKFYQVTLDRDVSQEDIDAIAAGLTLEDGLAPVDAVGYIDGGGKNEVGIEIHIGRNRIVRRIFESLGYRVERLDRTYYAGLTKKDLSRGWSRHLTHKEVIMLKHFSKK